MDGTWYWMRDGQQHGPISHPDLAHKIAADEIHPDDLVWHPGMTAWEPASTVPGACAPPQVRTNSVNGMPPPLPHATAPDPHQAEPAPLEPECLSVAISAPVPNAPTAVDAAAPRRANYFLRHWRGELSLAKSYWLNGVLATIVAFLVIRAVAEAIGRISSNYTTVAIWIATWAILLLITLWQLVGIWRSASKRDAAGKRNGWAGLAKVAVVLGVLRTASEFMNTGLPAIRQSIDQADWLNENAKTQFRLLRNGSELEISGGIGHSTAAELEKFLEAAPSVRLVHVNLQMGGLMPEAKRAREAIRTRGLSTYTSTSCVSACTIVYMGGTQRYAKKGSRLGFHAPTIPGVTGSDEQAMLAQERDYLISIGVASGFAQRALTTPTSTMWYPSEPELLSAGVVTAMTDGEDFALSGVNGTLTIEKVDEQLQSVRLFKALRSAYPQTYSAILDTELTALKQGKSQAELRTLTLPLLSPKVTESLPFASDEALLDWGRLVMSELRTLQTAPGRICFDYFMGKPDGVNAAVRLFSSETKEADLNVMAGVLESADRERVLTAKAKAKASRLLERAFKVAHLRVGDEIVVLANLNSESVDTSAACRSALALFSALLALPPNDAALAIACCRSRRSAPRPAAPPSPFVQRS